jgi:hypothetical protein
MAIVLPFIEREREQVLRLLAWIAKLSGSPLRRALYLVPFKGLRIDDVLTAGRTAFVDVQVIADSEGAASDWKKDDKVRDAAGPNSLFRQAAWFFHLRPKTGPWLWLEPDCVPLVPAWDEAIELAYRASGKPFFGAKMKFKTGDEYLNGAAVYARDAVGRAPALVTRAMWAQFPEMEIAFDVAGGVEVLRQASFTDLIQLDYRGNAEPREGAVILHGDRYEELLARLSKGGETHGRRKPKTKPADTANATAAAVVNGNGAARYSDVAAAPSVGDEIRYHVGALVSLASNSNRRTRILSALRKTTLLPRIAR